MKQELCSIRPSLMKKCAMKGAGLQRVQLPPEVERKRLLLRAVNCVLSVLFSFRIEVFRYDEDLHTCHRALFLGCVVNSDCFNRVAGFLCERNVINLMP